MGSKGLGRHRRCRRTRQGLAAFLFGMIVVFDWSGQATARELVVKSAYLTGDGKHTRFVAELSQSIRFRVFALSDPYRVIVDLPEMKFQIPSQAGKKPLGLVTAFRYGLFAPGKARIVIDAKGPVRIDLAKLEPVKGRSSVRLVLDMVPTDVATFAKVQVRGSESSASADRATRTDLLAKRRSGSPRKMVIAIDPGHGGIDSGAVNRSGVKEKDIALQFAKALRAELERRKGYDVVMTRDTDVFIPLGKRVEIARANACKLFISIHTDSLPKRYAHRVRGATVYTLSENGSDAVARALAAKENKSDIIAGVELEEKEDILAGILIDLAQRETKIRSSAFAQTILSQIKRSTKLNKQPHRSAAFQVLKAPDIPSVLLELGYLSNGGDARLLRSKNWRAKVAKRVALAVDNYFEKRLAGFPF